MNEVLMSQNLRKSYGSFASFRWEMESGS